MIKLRKAHMPLVTIAMSIALIFSLSVTGYFVMPSGFADSNITDGLNCDGQPFGAAALSNIDNLGAVVMTLTDNDRMALTENDCKKLQLEIAGPETARPGETIECAYTITNTHTESALSAINIEGTDLRIETLAAGQSATLFNKFTVPADANGEVTITGKVVAYHESDSQCHFPVYAEASYITKINGSYVPSATVTTSSEAAVNQNTAAKISVSQLANVASAGDGDTIVYTYTVKNTGSVWLYDVTLTDSKVSSASLPAGTILLPGEELKTTASYKISDKDQNGVFTNTATVKGYYKSNDQFISTAGLQLSEEARQDLMDIVTSSEFSLSSPQYSGSVENTSTGNVLIQEKSGILMDSTTAADTNLVTSSKASDDDDKEANISLEITPSRSTASVGDTVKYKYRIKNNGDYPFYGVCLKDDKMGDKALGFLGAGQQMTVYDSYKIKNSDVTRKITTSGLQVNTGIVTAGTSGSYYGEFKNTATATGYYSCTKTVKDKDSAVVGIFGSESISIDRDPAAAAPVEPVEVPDYPVNLPNTGGNTVAFGLMGLGFVGLGILFNKRSAS